MDSASPTLPVALLGTRAAALVRSLSWCQFRRTRSATVTQTASPLVPTLRSSRIHRLFSFAPCWPRVRPAPTPQTAAMRAKASDVLTAEVLQGRARSRARLGLDDEEDAAGAAGAAAAAAEQGTRGVLAGAGAPRDKVSPRATAVRGEVGGIATGSHRGGGGAGGGTGLGSGGGDSLAEHAAIQMTALGGAAAADPLGEGSATSLLRRGGGGNTTDGAASGIDGKRRRGSVRSSPLSLSVVTAALRNAADGGGAQAQQHAEPPRVFWCEAFASEPGRDPGAVGGAAMTADGGVPGAGGGSARKRRLPSSTGPAQAREVFEWLLAVAI
jgi:hypothetical protein